jgi:hypothetical protein
MNNDRGEFVPQQSNEKWRLAAFFGVIFWTCSYVRALPLTVDEIWRPGVAG